MTDTIGTGVHWVEAACPRCGALETIAVGLHSVLTVPDDDAASMRVRAKSKAVDHSCGAGAQAALLSVTGVGAP